MRGNIVGFNPQIKDSVGLSEMFNYAETIMALSTPNPYKGCNQKGVGLGLDLGLRVKESVNVKYAKGHNPAH